MSNTPSGLPATAERVVVVIADASAQLAQTGARDSVQMAVIAALIDAGVVPTVIVCADENASGQHGLVEWPVGVRDLQFVTSEEIGAVAATIASAIATSGSHAMVVIDHPSHRIARPSDTAAGELHAVTPTLDAARRAATVMDVPLYRGTQDRELALIMVGGFGFVRDGFNGDARRPQWQNPPDWHDQSTAMRLFATGAAFVLGAATGALGTVSQAWTVPVGGVTLPVGLTCALVVTTCLLTGLRLAFASRTLALWAGVGLLGVTAVLTAESAGGSVLLPAVTSSYSWVYGTVVLAVIVLAWPRIDRSPLRSMTTVSAASERPEGAG